MLNQSTFNSPGGPLSDRELERFETAVGLPITGEYRAFLLMVNGGILPNQWPRVAGSDWSSPEECFYSLDVDGRIPEHRSLLHHANQFRSRLPEMLTDELWGAGADDVHWQADVLPIGGDNSYFTLFFAVRGEYTGRLHLHDNAANGAGSGCTPVPTGHPRCRNSSIASSSTVRDSRARIRASLCRSSGTHEQHPIHRPHL